MFQKIAKHRANDASHDVHRPPLTLLAHNTSQNSHKYASIAVGKSRWFVKIIGIFVEYFLAVEMYFCRDYTWKTFVFES